MATKYERFLRFHDIDIEAIEQAVEDHANLAGLEDVNAVGATTGQVLTRLMDGTYGFSTPTAGDAYTQEETDDLLNLKVNVSSVGANSGVAQLDSGGKLPSAQLTTHNHDTLYYTKSQIDTSLGGKSNTGHAHAISDVTGLQTALDNKLDDSQLGAASGVASLDSSTKVPFGQLPTGATSSTVVVGNDSRLSDARTPTSHASSHASIGADPITPASIGAVATTAVAAASGVASLDSGTKVPIAQIPTGTSGTTVSLGNHTHTGYQATSEKGSASGYASLDSGVKVPIAQLPTGTSSTTVAIGNDSRLSDARTPTAHASSHNYNSSDPLTLTIAVANAAARPATSLYTGFTIYRIDRKWVEIYDGTSWRVQGIAIASGASDLTTAVDAPYSGQQAYRTDSAKIYQYDGSVWVPEGQVGGRISTGAGFINSAIAGTETNISKIGISGVKLVSGRFYMLNVHMYANFSVAGDSFTVRVRRDTAVSGTIIAEFPWITDVSGYDDCRSFSQPYKAPANASSANFFVSVQRAAGTGTCSVNGDSRTSQWVDDLGADSAVWSTVA